MRWGITSVCSCFPSLYSSVNMVPVHSMGTHPGWCFFLKKYWALLPSGGETEIRYSSTIKIYSWWIYYAHFQLHAFIRALYQGCFAWFTFQTVYSRTTSNTSKALMLGYISQFPFLELAAPQKRVWTAGGWASCAQSIFMIPTLSDIIQRQDLKTVWSEPWEQFEAKALATPGTCMFANLIISDFGHV